MRDAGFWILIEDPVFSGDEIWNGLFYPASSIPACHFCPQYGRRAAGRQHPVSL